MAQKRIPHYSNGNCPLHRLEVLAVGRNAADGEWVHRLPRATRRRWNALRKRAFARTGRWLYISDGWATDRPYWVQVIAKQKYGKYAATPGTSSHGMVFIGLQTAAIDAGNWSWVYANHGYDAWLADLRAEGFDRLPDGYQQEGEYHHIIDYNPWDDEPEFGGGPASEGSTSFEEEDDMYTEADRTRDANTYAAVWKGGSVTIDGVARKFNYGILPIVAHNQTLIAKQAGQLAAIASVVEQLTSSAGVVIDMAAVEAAAERGAEKALDGLTLRVVSDEG